MAIEYSTSASADGAHRHIYEIEGGVVVRHHHAHDGVVDSTVNGRPGTFTRSTRNTIWKTPIFPGSAHAWSIVRFDAEWERLTKVP